SSEEIWDYVGGVVDIRARRLKLIGAPVTRFREDPVRMLRAVRLAAKGGPAVDSKTGAATPRRGRPIPDVPPAGPPVRRNAEAPAVRPRGGDPREPARARAVARSFAAARRDSGAASWSAV